MGKHLAAGVKPNQNCLRVHPKHSPRRLAGAHSKVEHPLRPDCTRRCHLLLKTLIVRHLLAHKLEVAIRIPMKLGHAHSLVHEASPPASKRITGSSAA